MSQFIEQPKIFDKIILLSGEERRQPERVIRKFYGNYHLHECRHILWTMVETCLSTDHVNFSEAEDRADLLMRTKHIEELMEAAFLLYQREDRKDNKATAGAAKAETGEGKKEEAERKENESEEAEIEEDEEDEMDGDEVGDDDGRGDGERHKEMEDKYKSGENKEREQR